MKEKFEKIYNKVMQTKCLSTIKQHFINTTSNETWKVLNDQITNNYLIIPNMNMWSRDFVYGGAKDVYLVPAFFDAYTHNRSVKQLNTFNGGLFGDVMTMIRSFNDYHASCINLMDFGLFIQILSIMVVYSFFRERQARIEGTNMSFEINLWADWFIRQTVAQLTLPEENSHVTYNLHFPNFIECNCYGDLFTEVMKDHTKFKKAKIWVSPDFYRSMIVGSYFEFIGNLKLKDGFNGPNLMYHEAICTPMQKAILTSDKFSSISEAMNYLQLYGINETINKFDIEKVEGDNEELFLYNDDIEYAHSVLHSRKNIPDHVFFMKDNPCDVDYTKLTETPIASCIINADSLMYNNSTKDNSWALLTLVQLYTNAQTINRLRVEFQSEHRDKPLLVTIICSNDDIIKPLKQQVENITASLRSTYEYDFKYEITGGYNGSIQHKV